MHLTYHRPTFDYLNRPPQVSSLAVQALDEFERALQLELPASVREWFSLQHAETLLIGNQDQVLPLQDIAWEQIEPFKPNPNAYENSEHKLWVWRVLRHLKRAMLVLILENQGVCEWAVDVSSGDDPPVWIRKNEPGATWEACADRFSTFVYTRVWDQRAPYGLVAIAPPVDDAVLEHLRQDFHPEPSTHSFIDSQSYRFSQGRKRLHLMRFTNQTDWRLHANDPQTLLELGRQVWEIANSRKTWWHEWGPTSNSQPSVLERLRAEFQVT